MEDRVGWSDYKQQKPNLTEVALGRKRPPGFPAWIKLEKQVLKFWTYFTEEVRSERVEKERLRKCILFYYLEDDSIQLVEPKVGNSGIPQGRNHWKRNGKIYEPKNPKVTLTTVPYPHLH